MATSRLEASTKRWLIGFSLSWPTTSARSSS